MIEAPQPRNGKSNWWKEVISVLRNGWLTTAIAVEVLGLLAAFATIPGLPLPTALMLSVTGILSAGGVLIVTVYFMLQYNRRPLNYIQAGEVSNMLSPYLRSELAQDGFVPKSELSELVQGFGLFWLWQYQKSIVELRRAIDKLRSQPGFVIVAQFGTPEGLVLQRRFLNLVSFWPEIASRKARPQSCQARWQVAMKRCSRSLSGEPSL